MRNGVVGVVALSLMWAGCVGTSTPSSEDNAATEAPVCAGGATVKGIDVSYYQGTVNWAEAKASGIDFAFARVADGTDFIDPQFAANWTNMKAAGVVRGAYQFFRPETDPTAQANLLVAQIKAAGGFESGDLAPTIDVEVTDSIAVSTILANIQTWLDVVEAATGLTPTIYVSPGFWSTLGNPTSFGAYALWDADWTTSCPTVPTSSWSTWQFWQNADTGTVPGVGSDPDLDVFNGSLTQLLAYAGGKGGGTPPTCTVAGVAGTCIETSACSAMAGYKSTAGYCPGTAAIECCTPTGSSSSSSSSSSSTSSSTSSGGSTSSSSSSSSTTSSSSSSTSSTSGAPPPACDVDGVAGTCIAESTCATMPGYTSTAGYCPGPASEECCTPPPSCSVAGVAGICVATSECAKLAGHKSTPGYCPGPSTEECCTP